MLAVAQWLFKRGAMRVCIHPDGMHTRYFDLAGQLEQAGFRRMKSEGKTTHAGVWVRSDRTLEVHFQPGKGDVVADIGDQNIVVEAKGGCINSRYPGKLSQLRTRTYEAVGSLFNAPKTATCLIAAVPRHAETEKLARGMADRLREAGFLVALVSSTGEIRVVPEPRVSAGEA